VADEAVQTAEQVFPLGAGRISDKLSQDGEVLRVRDHYVEVLVGFLSIAIGPAPQLLVSGVDLVLEIALHSHDDGRQLLAIGTQIALTCAVER
jgi:hypothetical protein